MSLTNFGGLFLPLFILILHWLSDEGVLATHFRGGIIMVRPVDGGALAEMEIFFRMSYRRTHPTGGNCNSVTVANGQLISASGEGDLECQYGCSGSVSSMAYYCTDFSISENWAFGERRVTYDFTASINNTVTIGFSRCCWLDPFNGDSWNVSTTFSLVVRNDTGKINSSPRAITSPVLRLQQGCNHTIVLAVSDPDGDIIRCRWAVGTECAGVCNEFPGAVLDSDSCSLDYQSTNGVLGFNAVALMVEDFVPGSTQPFSSVALQFLVFVYTSTEPCNLIPQFIDPTLPQGLCVAIPPGANFTTQLRASGQNLSIIEIQTVSPRGATKGELQQIEGTNSYYVNITWMPTADQQNQTHLFCFTAINSESVASEQSCIQLLVGYYPPTPYPFSVLPIVHPANAILQIRFDKSIQRTSVNAFVRFHEMTSEQQVYTINALSSSEVTFNDSTRITISPNFLFVEKRRYYINLDVGIVKGIEGCGPGNEPATNKTFFVFQIMDITPPIITFVHNPSHSNENITVSWSTNENITTLQCYLMQNDTRFSVNCSNGIWNGYNLNMGMYRLNVSATDDAGNVGTAVHTFEVDLTPPNVTIIQQPNPLSNNVTPTFMYTCNEICTFECQLSFNQSQDNPSECNNAIFVTRPLLHNTNYTLSIVATDQVGNRGKPVTYSWETDFEGPTILGVSNISVPCNNTNTSHTGQALATDDNSLFPSVTHSDNNLGCSLRRTWLATDEAGNTGSLAQYINLEFSPVLTFLAQVFLLCDNSTNISINTVTVLNPCSLPHELSYTDSVNQYLCPSEFVRNWTISICNRTATYSQSIILYDLCSPYACGRNERVPRGICSFGECQCNLPCYGENCSNVMYKPIVEPVTNSTLREAQFYSVNLTLIQGTPPLSWNLILGPSQLSIDQYTGQVVWPRAQTGKHTIIVTAENQVGEANITWTLQVSPGYSTLLHPVSPTVYSRTQPILLSGAVQYTANNSVEDFLVGIVPVFIDIINNGSTRTLNTTTNANGSYFVTFYPAVTEYGFYQASSRHPGVSNAAVQAEWTYSTIVSVPNIIELVGEADNDFDKTFYNASVIYNRGPTRLYGIKAIPLLSDMGLITVEAMLRGLTANNTLEPGSATVLDIKLCTSQPLRGVFVVVLNSTQGTLLQIIVSIEIELSLPRFSVEPFSLSSRVVRGQSRIFEFNITNIGQTVATTVQPLLPANTNIISFVSFGNIQQGSSSLNLSSRQSAVLSIFVRIEESQELGDITTSISIVSTETSVSIPITLTVSSNLLMNLTVVVEDEFTYFASGQPLVNNAAITLINYQRNIRMTSTTDRNNGTATFVNIFEDRYEMFIEAPNHLSLHEIIITSLDTPVITKFIQRQTVTYTWSVTPIAFQDNYIFTIEADFVTHVPLPVVTVTPTEIDLEALELGLLSSFQINITNHGLIRANDTTLLFPTSHPFLEFSTSNNELGYIDPLSSIIVNIRTAQGHIQKRQTSSSIISYLILIAYSYICGDMQLRTISVVLRKPINVEVPTPVSIRRLTCINCNTPINDGQFSGFRGSIAFEIPDAEFFYLGDVSRPRINFPDFNFNGYTSTTPSFCNACLQSVIGCLPTPNFPLAGCIPLVLSQTDPRDSFSNALSWIGCIIGGKWSRFACGYDLYNNCFSGDGSRKRRNIGRTLNDVVEALYPILQSIDLGIEVLGDEAWLSVGDSAWLSHVLQPVMDDGSDVGVLISIAELSIILATPPPNGTIMAMVKTMIERLNNTIYGWNSGQLEPSAGYNMASLSKVQGFTQNIDAYNDISLRKGFSSYLDAYNFASSEINKLDQWEEEAGVCAVVRIRIEQELAVTRIAFLAKLEIENKETSSLVGGSLEIIIVDSGTGVESTHLFAIGNGTYSGSLTADTEGWSLPSEGSGSVEWLIIPYSEAAPKSDRTYDVGGILRYSLENENITIRLFPSLITVTPDPSLLVHYFWERNVIGDDPFTDEIENSVPFTLGVAVRNAGYGTASSLQITSGKPEIIENEKGLLIGFRIINATLGNTSADPSLTLMFGDLPPDSTVVARWFMISNLQGEFRGYTATFQNVNPLGDPNLSILDELEIHELIRNIRMYDTSEEDGVLDFLVNELDDLLAYPDALYSSKSLERYNVSIGTVHSLGSTAANLLEVRTTSSNIGWVYYRYEDTQELLRNVISFESGVKQERNSINVSIPTDNFWITRESDSVYLHIVDNVTTTNEIVFNLTLCISNCPTIGVQYIFPTPTFAVSIEADPPGNNTNSSIIEYVHGSDFTVRCFVAPVPPPGSEFSWSCSTGCLDNATVQETVNITELGLLRNVVINCSIFINNNHYFSELVEIDVVGILVTGITPRSGQLNSIVRITGLFPPLTGDSTTVTAVFIGGIPSELLASNETSIVVRVGFSQSVIPSATIMMVTEQSSYQIAGTTWNHTAPGNITMVTPSSGQNGTKVVIKGDNLVESLSIPRVLLAGNEAIVESANSTTILCRAMSGDPKNGSIIVNYTETVDGVLYNGPTISKSNAWEQFANGNITKIVPSSVAINQTVLLCGDSPLGGGKMTESVMINGANTAPLSSMAFVVGNYSCINAMLPDNLTAEVDIVITADTGAVVISRINITIAAIDSVSRNLGQYGSRVNILGSELFSNITSTHVMLAGINATIEEVDDVNRSWITVRAGRPPSTLHSKLVQNCTTQLQEACNMTSMNCTNATVCVNFTVMETLYPTFTGPVTIIVQELGREFILTSSLILWTYNTTGMVFSVMPSFGQVGTRVALNGTNLYGYGTSLQQLRINGTTATILNDNDIYIKFVIPRNFDSRVGPVDIQLISDNGDIIEIVEGFEYRPAGMITNITPAVGQRGSYVNISGINLFGHGNKIMSVMFGPQRVDIINGTNSFVIVRITSYNNTAEVAVNVTIISDTFASVSSAPNIWHYLVEGKVTSVTPPQGQSGTFVNISGANLLAGGKNITSAYLDGILATVLNFTNSSVYVRLGINAQQRTDFVPGEIYLIIDTGAIVSAVPGVSFFFHELGIVTGFSPLVGREGTFITITGINLTAYGNRIIHVTIAGIDVLQNSIYFNSSDPTKLLVRAGPSNTTISGRILLFVDTGTIVNTNTTYNFTYAAPGIITTVTPSSGVEGTGVLIAGSDLYTENTSLVNVLLAGVRVTIIVAATRTSIAVIVGSPEATNDISTEVLITASDGSVAKGTAFKYNTPHQMKIIGPILGQFGTRVSLNVPANFTISGKLSRSILVDDIPAIVSSIAGTIVTITIPRPKKIDTYPVNIVMQNTKGEIARLVDGFTYIQEGEIIKVTPRSGQQGTIVTLTGYGLLGGGNFIQSATLANLPATVVNSNNSLVVLQVTRNSNNSNSILGDIVLIANTGAVIRQQRGWTATVPAVISNVHPEEGQLGTYVTITGSDLLQDGLKISSVQLAGVNAYSIESFSSTAVVVRAPNTSSSLRGAVKIILETEAYTESSVLWTYNAQTVITSVFPVIGAVGSTVMIQLAQYSSESDSIKTVLLDNANCSILAIGMDFVNITIPVQIYSTGPVGVVIETTSGVIISKNAVFTVEELGNINTVTPRIIQQGITVNISGYNFLGRSNVTYVTAVRLAGVQANQIISQNNSSVIVEAGYSTNNVSGNVELLLNTAVHIYSNITVSYYQSQILSVTPNGGYNASQLNIIGINLIQPNSTLASVMIGNALAIIEGYSSNYIIARAGEPSIGDINVNMTIKVTSQSGAYIELHNGWRYIAIPTITRVQPNTINGGEIITIHGRDLPADNPLTILIGGISVQQLLYANSTVIQARAPYGINRPELQQIQLFAADRSVVTSIPLVRYNAINYTILNVSPYAGQNGTKVNITFNSVPPNITTVYLSAVNVTNIIHISNTTITVTAGYGSNTTGDVIIEATADLLIGLQNGWSYLPELNSSQVIPQQGQSGTSIIIRVGTSLLVKYNISAVSLAGVPANLVGIAIDTVLVKASSSSYTGLSDVILSFQVGVVLLIPQSWTYLPDINITSVSSNAMGYFGTVVVINGINFLNGQLPTQVKLNVALAGSINTNILSFNDTTIVCNISQFVDSVHLPIVGPITVNNSFGFSANTSGILNFTYLDVDIMNVFPNQGQNGTIVTIQGTGLLAGATNITRVLLNDIPVHKVMTTTNNMIVIQAAHSYRSTSLGNITYFTDTGAKITVPNVWRYVPPAVVNSITPFNGTEGTIVTIRGTGLLAGSIIGPSSVNSVYLDGTATSEVLIAFDTVIQVITNLSSNDDSIPGAVSIHLSSGAWIFTTKTFNYFQPGVITSISPLEGQNGTIVNITGTSLYPIGDSLMSVALVGVNAHIVSATTNFIQVVAARPSILESFSGAVIIQALSGALLKYKISNFTYLQEGIIYSVFPSTGQNGTTVKIKGYNLFGGGSGIRGVWLAGIAAYIDPDSSNDCIVVTVGENIASDNKSITGDVLLVSTSGAHMRRIDGWLYEQKGVILSITPSSGQYGTEIMIAGMRLLSGSTAVSSVTIGGVALDITMSSDSVIRGKIGDPMNDNAYNGTVIITSSHGGILVSNYTWSYNKRGIINNFTPQTGGNNATIKITGTNLLGSSKQIVQATVAGTDGANIESQNNTLVVIQLGISTVALNITGPITLVSNTGAIIQSTDMFTIFVPCDLNQFIVNNSDSIDCVNCSSVCASCSGPTDSDCTECAAASFVLQTLSNGTKQCTKQCRQFANSDRECIDSCELDQYQSHNDVENTTFCYNCHDLCAPNYGCTGPASSQCRQCMSFRYRMECVSECPQHTYADQLDNCIQCHSLCNQSAGCTGPLAADCNSCAHLRHNTTDMCVNKCPSNYYINGATCLPCDPLCLGRCKGNGPQQCEECRFARMRLLDGSTECVSSCNQPFASIYYLDNSTGFCERCSEFCSLVDGCDGPSPTNCHRCRTSNSSTPATFKFDTACILDCTSMSNDTSQYYNDLVTLTCQLCDFSCDKGCAGPGPFNCITAAAPVEKTETFEAGTGTIIVFFSLCAVLIMLIIICSGLLMKKCRHSKYNHHLSHSRRQNTETGSRYVVVRSSEETEFKRSAAIKGTPEELAANTIYTDVPNNDNMMDVKANTPQVNPELELYVDVPNAPQQNGKQSNLAVTNPIACGEYEFPVPSTTTVNSSDGGNVYDDTEHIKTPYHKDVKNNSPVVALPSDKEKRLSMPIPSNPLQISLSKITSPQQRQQDAVYEVAQTEDTIYDHVGVAEGLQSHTTPKSS